MARVNITVPDETLEQARAAGLNVSHLASSALTAELDRLSKIRELDRYLNELESELGPIPASEQRAADEWAKDAIDGAAPTPRRHDRRTA